MAGSNAHPNIQYQKSLNFKGSVRILIRHLRSKSAREVDEKNVERLVQVYRLEGCQRMDPMHYVPATIESETFVKAVSAAGLDQVALQQPHDEPPLLDLPSTCTVTCLHGKHRLLAAEKFLPASQHWWTVNLYDETLPLATQRYITQEYGNALQFSDGDVFRYVRANRESNNKFGVKKWMARLSASKRRNLLQMEKIPILIKAFDSLRPLTGLWPGFLLGSLNRILPMRCYEEYSRYLSHVYKVWTAILGPGGMAHILDVKTVDLISLLAPKLSLQDGKTITSWMSDGTIFPLVSDTVTRDRMLARILECGRIPTIHSFFEDTIYLEACQNGLKRLLPNRSAYKESFQSAFEDIYTGKDNCFQVNYMELWLFAMRYFPELSDVQSSTPRKEKGKKKPVKCGIVGGRLDEMAYLAASLGFQSAFVEHRLTSLKAKPMLEEASDELPVLTFEWVETARGARCNRPFENSFYRDRKNLFPQQLYRTQAGSCKDYISTFGIAREIVSSFWGPEIPSGLDDAQRRQTPTLSKFMDLDQGEGANVTHDINAAASSEDENIRQKHIELQRAKDKADEELRRLQDPNEQRRRDREYEEVRRKNKELLNQIHALQEHRSEGQLGQHSDQAQNSHSHRIAGISTTSPPAPSENMIIPDASQSAPVSPTSPNSLDPSNSAVKNIIIPDAPQSAPVSPKWPQDLEGIKIPWLDHLPLPRSRREPARGNKKRNTMFPGESDGIIGIPRASNNVVVRPVDGSLAVTTAWRENVAQWREIPAMSRAPTNIKARRQPRTAIEHRARSIEPTGVEPSVAVGGPLFNFTGRGPITLYDPQEQRGAYHKSTKELIERQYRPQIEYLKSHKALLKQGRYYVCARVIAQDGSTLLPCLRAVDNARTIFSYMHNEEVFFEQDLQKAFDKSADRTLTVQSVRGTLEGVKGVQAVIQTSAWKALEASDTAFLILARKNTGFSSAGPPTKRLNNTSITTIMGDLVLNSDDVGSCNMDLRNTGKDLALLLIYLDPGNPLYSIEIKKTSEKNRWNYRDGKLELVLEKSLVDDAAPATDDATSTTRKLVTVSIQVQQEDISAFLARNEWIGEEL